MLLTLFEWKIDDLRLATNKNLLRMKRSRNISLKPISGNAISDLEPLRHPGITEKQCTYEQKDFRQPVQSEKILPLKAHFNEKQQLYLC